MDGSKGGSADLFRFARKDLTLAVCLISSTSTAAKSAFPSFFLLYFLRPPTSCITKTEEEEPAQPGSTEEGTTD